ncbi:MAG: methylcobamide--CoM methyltransferase [Chloroflexi bacterium]|nr:methylcobamide--CoM methyltransferase [Chloroflexota bacterium]
MIATVVGSYPKIPNKPRPARLRNAINKLDRGAITPEELAQVADEVTIEVLQEQADAGLDLVTDGQIRWDDEQTYLAGALEGVSISGLIRWFDTNMYYRQPAIETAIAWREPITVRDFSFAVEHSAKPVKAVLTGPYTLARLSVDRHYNSVDALALAFAEALNQEAKALQDAGASLIQINEPAILQFKDDYAAFAAACSRVTDGLTAETALYLYFGDAEGIYPQILDLPFDLIGLDFVMGPQNEALLKRSPFTKKLGLGIIDARNTRLESPDDIAKKIRTLGDGIDPDRIHVSPSAGLEFLPREVAQEKLRQLAQGVRQAEGVPA